MYTLLGASCQGLKALAPGPRRTPLAGAALGHKFNQEKSGCLDRNRTEGQVADFLTIGHAFQLVSLVPVNKTSDKSAPFAFQLTVSRKPLVVVGC